MLGAEKLKPISWRDWAGEIERDGGARNPYMALEERYNFWDIRVSGVFYFIFYFSLFFHLSIVLAACYTSALLRL